MSTLALWLALTAIAFLLRIGVHVGRLPSGVDTWYYLAYADAARVRPRIQVQLPQYLLQDVRQSYAPLFPLFLALVPKRLLRQWFWIVSPVVDCVHLGLLYWLCYRITGSTFAAGIAGAIYAFTPQLISETRSLNGRAFGALLHSLAMLLLLRYVLLDAAWPWLPLAVLAGAAVYLASATASVAYGLVSFVLTMIFADGRYLAVALVSILVAVAVSGGHFLQVVRNYVQAGEYWRRNRGRYGAHPVYDSPVYGDALSCRASPPGVQGPLGRNVFQQLARLLGENPFILALPLAPYGPSAWSQRLAWWAIAVSSLAVLATLVPPLRVLGPGRSYMKAAAFPTAYTLAIGIDGVYGLSKPVGLAASAGLVLSIGAIGFFYRYTARRVTEHTSSSPVGLVAASHALKSLPDGGVLCLPYMYADYVCYNAGKPVLWGGHCGDLRAFEQIAPVIRVPLPKLFRKYGVKYVLLDTLYTCPEDIGLLGRLRPIGTWDTFELHEFVPSGATNPVSSAAESTSGPEVSR